MTQNEFIDFLEKKSEQLGGAEKLARWVTDLTGVHCSYFTALAWIKKRRRISATWQRIIELSLERNFSS